MDTTDTTVQQPTRITSPFTSRSTALEVVDGVDLTGRRAVVTGGASGIGVETARALAHAGAEVVLAVRDTAAGERAAADIAASASAAAARSGGPAAPAPRVEALDLADLTSVDAFTARWGELPLHVLVANAGVMDTPHATTAQGFELQLGTNHLGHFVLTTGLHAALAAGAREAGEARVVVVSSSGHGASPVVFEDLMFERRPYDPGLAYGQAKTANSLFAVELTRRWAHEGITANALMPGGIWTPLQRHWSPQQRAAAEQMAQQAEASGSFHMKTPEQGAATSVFLATSPLVAGVGGRYFEDCAEAEVVEQVRGIHGVMPHALDPEAARRLWEVSEQVVGAARG
ncbi:SDR family NAD(P)-dependent oxidoreductase [Quadrisphaera sp. KR29]|uniref:SDR family NAD(P)-dependent oxidoreductase n=1 Tax=Quadrisphaera sp. KR29 TaxID=3461391 RepID=UPI00404450D9